MAEIAVPFLVLVIDKLFERIASPEFRRLHSTAYKLKQLKSKLKDARLFLYDADDRQLTDAEVKSWLTELKDVIFQADDFAEEIHNNKNKQVLGVIKSLARPFLRTPMDEILEDMDDLLKRAGHLGLKHVVRSSSLRSAIPWREESDVHGRNNDKEEILKLMRSDEAFGSQRIGVVPIVGMGGMGKTTLARIIYDHFQVKETRFELSAWVSVSVEFDYCKILKTILKEINDEERAQPEDTLQQRLRDVLRGKKFIFFLDDVWNENPSDWDLLWNIFSSGAPGSRIVVTTQSTEVGSIVTTGPMHELREVSRADCWKIFSDHAFKRDPKSHQQLHVIGEKIVEKCKGLPLAVKEIGGYLCSKKLAEWEKVSESHMLSGKIQVLSKLWRTYVSLSRSQRQCFAYCSAFPKGYKFCKKQMVLLWMVEGFLPSDETGEESMEELGEKNFDSLVSKFLLRQSGEDESKFVMHDLYHELAAFASDKSYVSLSANVKLGHVTTSTRHLSHSSNVSFDSTELWTVVSTAKHLRTFLGLSDDGDFPGEFVKKLITNQSCLRVLALYTKDSISVSFRNLKHLLYLNLSRSTIVEVPSSVCDLDNLQTLLLSECSSLTQLPGKTKKLKKLRHLDITGTNLTNMPPKMGHLKELRTLTNFVLGDSDGCACSKIKEIGELQHLSELRISRLQNVDKSEVVGNDILKHKENLKELALEWDDSETGTRRDAEELVNALRPHAKLKKLVIRNYPDLSFPSWVGELSTLVSVELKGVFCNSLPPLWSLSHLLKLLIEGFHPVEKIDHEFYGNSTEAPFQCLETLEFRDMRSLKVWVFHEAAFPRLKNLTLFGCPEMESFPEAELHKRQTHLRIDNCAKLKRQ